VRPLTLARLYALKSLWTVLGCRAAGRALVTALGSTDEGERTVAGMFLVQGGRRAEPLVADAIRRREHLPIVLLVAGDIGARSLEPDLRRLAADPDPDVARAARDALEILSSSRVRNLTSPGELIRGPLTMAGEGTRGALRRLVWLVPLVLIPACAPTRRIPSRAPTDAEIRVLEQAVKPLLEELDPATRPARRDCPLGLVVVQSPTINAGTKLGDPAGGCPAFTIGVTEGMLRRLSLDMLRAVLAHELGHMQLGHLEGQRSRGQTAAIFRPLTAAFDRQQETEADRFAVDLLRRIEPRQPGACVALVYVFALLAEQPLGSAWLASHPSPDGRAEAALARCNRG
jgi:Peptidase family M48